MEKDTQHLNQCKADQSIIWPFDLWLKHFLIPYIPAWIHPNHLTLMSIVWVACSCLASYLAAVSWNIFYLWIIVVALLGHYITDLLDGELWRVRKAWYILRGFYMDHFFDYIFFVAIVGSLYFVIPDILQGQFVVLWLLISMLFVHLHIVAAVQDTFMISFHRFGPSEFRLFAILAVIVLMYYPAVWMYVLPILIVFVFVILVVAIYNTQKQLGQQDMENKRKL